jgi:MFS family permease
MIRIYLMNFLLAISTTIGMTIIPFLITDSLGLSLLVVGILEGSTEFFSNFFRLINGVLFDKVKNKRLIFVYSTGIALGSKLLLLLPTPWAILFAKTLERIANGAFASPRDAFVAENAKNKGLALGLLSISKTFGCVLGPIIVSCSTVFLGTLTENLRLFVIICCALVLPAFICSFSLKTKNFEGERFSIKELSGVFKKTMPILILVFLFFMGRFNDGLLMMYLKEKGLPEWFYLSTIAIFNGIMLITSPFIGLQIDRGQLQKMLYCTIGALGLFNVCFYQIDLALWPLAILGLVGWGVQRTGAQIVFSSLIFRSVPKSQYGTAIGIFYVINGVGILLASCISGYLAKNHFSSVFILSGGFSLLALFCALFMVSKKELLLGLQPYALTNAPKSA